MTRMSSENNKDEDEKNVFYHHRVTNTVHITRNNEISLFFVSSRSSIESVRKLNLLTIATIKWREQEEESEAIQ